jgi:ElaB/YqjD/DUF883 family membrane-anchored ribosome-binding protein
MSITSSLNHTADEARSVLDRAPALIGEAGAQLESLTQRGIDRARKVSATVREQAGQATERTVGYIQEQPVKSVLIAAAAGAALTLLAGALSRRRGD